MNTNDQANESPEQAKKRPLTSGAFKKGDPGIRPLKQVAKEAGVPLEDPAVAVVDDDLLTAMKHVQSLPKSADRTELQKDCRAWKQKDLKGFMTKRAELEKAAPSKPDAPTPSEEPVKGTARALERCREWLEAHKPDSEWGQIGQRVELAWGGLSEGAKQTIRDILDGVPARGTPA